MRFEIGNEGRGRPAVLQQRAAGGHTLHAQSEASVQRALQHAHGKVPAVVHVGADETGAGTGVPQAALLGVQFSRNGRKRGRGEVLFEQHACMHSFM